MNYPDKGAASGWDRTPPEKTLPTEGLGSIVAENQDPWGPPRGSGSQLTACHATFRRWLGGEYDMEALDVVLAAAAVEQLDGDPVWLLVISGPGNAKTETVNSLAGAGAFVTSTITSEGALLSATAKKEQSAEATGGLLRRIGDRGLLVIKDFTSILSMNRDLRARVLAGLREVYDGRWERNVGTDGGLTLTWNGRLVLVGACTTAYDGAHAVISSMGDRFALVRIDSARGRLSAGRQALRNVGDEEVMRAELAGAVEQAMRGLRTELAVLPDESMEDLLQAADLVTMARSAVDVDPSGVPIRAHAPEMPTRFAKMLAQIVRGGLALGMSRDQALRAALRVARDSIPPERLAILEYVRANPGLTTRKIAKGIGRPASSTDRIVQALHLIGLVDKDEEEVQYVPVLRQESEVRMMTDQPSSPPPDDGGIPDNPNGISLDDIAAAADAADGGE